jgi:hypothetical protein
MKNRWLTLLCSAWIVTAQSAPARPDALFTIAPTLADPRAYIVTTDHARYSFTLPHGWAVRSRPEMRQIELLNLTGGTIEITFRDQPARHPDSLKGAEWLKNLEKKHAGATLVSQLEVRALSTKAAACDLEWAQSGMALRSGRFVLVPLKSGCLEFALTSPRENFGEHLPPFMQLMLSFRTSAADEPVPVRRNTPE